jgi:hypothetical protein
VEKSPVSALLFGGTGISAKRIGSIQLLVLMDNEPPPGKLAILRRLRIIWDACEAERMSVLS